MKFRVLGCYGGSVKGRHLSCYLLNDTIALDAGSLTYTLTLEEQLRIRHVIITHSHLDHNTGLPFFADNVFGRIDEPVSVYGSPPVVASLRKHMFNDVIWPDFSRLPSHHSPTLEFKEIHDGQPFRIDKLTFTPIPVNHITPTAGFVIRDSRSSIVFTSDTGPTEMVWEVGQPRQESEGHYHGDFIPERGGRSRESEWTHDTGASGKGASEGIPARARAHQSPQADGSTSYRAAASFARP